MRRRFDVAFAEANLGQILKQTGELSEAVKWKRSAVAEFEKLMAEFPSEPGHAEGCATACLNLAIDLGERGDRAGEESLLLKSVGILERLAEKPGAPPENAVDLAGAYCNLAIYLRERGKPDAGVPFLDKGIDRLDAVLKADPRFVKAKSFLVHSLCARARAADAADRHAAGLADWDRALSMSAPAERPLRRAARVKSLSRVGRLEEAVREVEEIAPLRAWPAVDWVRFASVCALASAAGGPDASRRADRSMEFLGRAVKSGFADARLLANDADLASLRDRVDFKALLRSMTSESSR
jgi:tetratricopeptide (TPR) repeat protein